MYKGWKLLTKKERKHLSEYKICRTYELEVMFRKQKEQRIDGYEPCWDCKCIARKLGYPV